MSLPPLIGRRPEAKTHTDRRQRLRRLDSIKAAAPLSGTARCRSLVDAGSNSRPRGLTTPSGSVITLPLCLTKLADQGSVYTHIAHRAR